jgi:Xaa-Pro aminopeptidase
MPAEHAERRARLASAIGEADADVALITRLVNVLYLTGLASSNAAVLLTANGAAVLATDGRYTTAAAAAAPDLEILQERNVASALATRAAADGVLRLGVEEHDVTLAVAEMIRKAAEPAELVHLGQPVEALRAVKSEKEITLIREACAISCRALDDLWIAGGLLARTEKQVARDLENRMYEHGADGIAFETIVASGPNSAVPHHRPTERTIGTGELLKIDFGALYRGYHADCTRTVVIGAEAASWQREIYDLVADAQTAGRASLGVGTECIAVDRAARDVIETAGYAKQFSHGTGHGVGLEIHEAPTLGYSAAGTLADRMPVTVEPGVYLPGRGGVRIEDTLVVRDTGGPELLTTTTKDLLVLDA